MLIQNRLDLLGVAVLVLLASSCTRQASYSTFEDCVLDEVDSVQTQAAVGAVRDACRSKFPPTEAELSRYQRISEQMIINAQAAADAANRAADSAAFQPNSAAEAAAAAAEAAAMQASAPTTNAAGPDKN